MVLGLVGLHWFKMVVVDKVAISPVRSIEYQSAETVRPGIKVGVITTPPEIVRATSGTRLGLPTTTPASTTVRPVFGSAVVPVLIEPWVNNSLSPGARMSTDQVVRSLMSSLTWLVAPNFQVSTRPEVE